MKLGPALHLGLGVGIGILCPGALHAGVEVLRGDLFGRVTAKTEANSNIYSNNLEEGDFIVSAVPEVGFKRDVALVLIDMSAGVSIMRFVDDTAQNDENPFGSALLRWAPEGGKTSGEVQASARQNAQANQDVNQRTLSNDYLLTGSFGHLVTEKLGYRLRSNYNHQDYSTPGLSDLYSFLGGVDARHQYSPKLESYVGYNYRQSWTSHRRAGAGLIDSTDHQFLLGLDGELLPKVKGRVAVGSVTRRFDQTSLSTTALFMDTAVAWQWRAGTVISLTGRRDFDTSPGNQSILRNSYGCDVAIQLSAKTSLSGGVTYSHENYTGGGSPRVDDAYNFNVRYGYSFTQQIQASAYASYRTTDSTSVSATYAQAIVGSSLAAKF